MRSIYLSFKIFTQYVLALLRILEKKRDLFEVLRTQTPNKTEEMQNRFSFTILSLYII